MENKKWLPSGTRNRLIDLCKDRNISQAQLAGVIGIDRSALSRFLSTSTSPQTFSSAKPMTPDELIMISGNWD